MPSASAKQHRFMEAVAHNPAFAKKVGISQSVGKDFSAADKGRTFNKGDAIMMKKGGMPPAAMAAMMARRRPPMGADMPSAPMGMKKNGMHKMPDGKMMKDSAMKKSGMPMKDGKPAFMKKFAKGGLTDNDYRQARQKDIAEKADARAARIKNKEDAVSKRAYNNAVRRYENELISDPKDTNPAGYAVRKFGDSVGDKMRSVGKFFGSNRVTSQDDAAQMQARKDVKGYRKGGMPMKDGKPAFMKKMNMGGMAKYAKGGGIESRGKTKGTVIRMASGGSVSARADGIAQRGKTNCKTV
jgi:hypothetical protein